MAKGRKIINTHTLEVFNTMKEAGRHYGVTGVAIYDSVMIGFKIKGQTLAFFDDWITWPSEKKEKFSRRNNIYFM